MTKAELIKALKDKLGEKQATIPGVVDALGETATELLGRGVTVALPGVGRFVVTERSPRVGRNPKTGEAVNIPAKRSVKFKPAKDLREALNSKEA